MLSVYGIHPPQARHVYVHICVVTCSVHCCSDPSDTPTHNQTLSTNHFAQCVPLSCEKRLFFQCQMQHVGFEVDLKGTLKASKDI